MPILYSFKRCPYAMRARMAIYLSQIVVEHREVSLKNKPKSMMEISPKGTVPVLLLENGDVIDESMDIINWCLETKSRVFKDILDDSQKAFTKKIIKIFDEKFKFHLDRYKYATRYKNVDAVSHRDTCLDILKTLDKNINNTKWFFSNNVNKIDISVLPFIRQFRIADPLWFDANQSIPNIQIWLENFLQSKLLNEVMINFDAWDPNDPIKLFPTNL
jgi:glutathione S-transferase